MIWAWARRVLIRGDEHIAVKIVFRIVTGLENVPLPLRLAFNSSIQFRDWRPYRRKEKVPHVSKQEPFVHIRRRTAAGDWQAVSEGIEQRDYQSEKQDDDMHVFRLEEVSGK